MIRLLCRASAPRGAWPLLAVFALVGSLARLSFADDPPAGGGSGPFVPLLSDEETWRCLPAGGPNRGGPLPAWARALARTLPRTTAAMLELDHAFRTSDALEPRLAAAVRLAVARAVGSDYGRAYAEADLVRLGLDRAAIDRLKGDPDALPEPDRAVLRFEAKLTTSGSRTTDAEVAELIRQFGEPKVVAIVLQVAFANFLDRLALALGLGVEPNGPVAPIDVRFELAEIPAAPRPPLPGSPEGATGSAKVGDSTGSTAYARLQKALEAQRSRQPRVSIPTWQEFRAAIPEALYPRARPLRIRWSLLVSGRQPKLGPPWIKCLRVFEEEARQDRVFEESLFWVVTRSLRCFYCMGHCEMLLEEAGLDRSAIAARTARLADGSWADFPPAERAAFAFAQRLTEAPSQVGMANIQGLVDRFGLDRALDVIWWASRCQFMTKVSDAFQLPLERENVFIDHLKPDEGPK